MNFDLPDVCDLADKWSLKLNTNFHLNQFNRGNQSSDKKSFNNLTIPPADGNRNTV